MHMIWQHLNGRAWFWKRYRMYGTWLLEYVGGGLVVEEVSILDIGQLSRSSEDEGSLSG